MLYCIGERERGPLIYIYAMRCVVDIVSVVDMPRQAYHGWRQV